MSTAQMAAQRRRRGHLDDTGAAVSEGDNTGRADAGPTVTVRVPLTFRRRRGRKVLVTPDGAGQEPPAAPHSSTLKRNEVAPAVRILSRAFRWRRLLESGAFATVHEIAAADGISPSYVSRVLRLTLLTPEIVETLLENTGDAPASPTCLTLPFPVAWTMQ